MGKSSLQLVAAVCLIAGLALPAARPTPQRESDPPPGVIRAGTRLVEVEVVVRDNRGPVTGLTADDFTVLDQGKRQKIAVFNAPQPSAVRASANPLPPDAISNRADRTGHAATGATVLLFDQLNTVLQNQGYARKAILNYLSSAPDGEQIAIYMLGKDLSVLQDFTGDRAVLTASIQRWNPANGLLLRQDTSSMEDLDDYDGDGPVYVAIRAEKTRQAIAKIVQHLSGMPGRKNLVWLSDAPAGQGAPLLTMADIHLYPVLARGVGSSGVFAWMRELKQAGLNNPPVAMASGNEIQTQRNNVLAGAAAGGVGFNDSADLALAVHTAVEDAANTYILGFYPGEEALDNKFHPLTVKVGNKGAARGRAVQIRARIGYFASRVGPRAPAPASIDNVLNNPLDATAVGVTAKAGAADGKYQLDVSVDLHDVYFAVENGRHVATIGLSFADSNSHQVETGTYRLSYSDAEFAAALDRGLRVSKVFAQPAMLRFVVRDATTGSAGSLWVAPPQEQFAAKPGTGPQQL